MGSDSQRIGKHWVCICLVLLSSTFLFLARESTAWNSIMVDEYAHLPAGISYWDLGRFYIYRENPPLVQALSALPVWLSGAKMNYSRADPHFRSEWAVGSDFLQANSPNAHRLYVRGRSVIVILALACGFLIFHWCRDIYGSTAAIVSAALWFLDPNVLAFSSVVTSDVGAATFGLLASYVFWRFLVQPTRGRLLLSGITLGFAQGCKFSLLALYPAFIIETLLARLVTTAKESTNDQPRSRIWFQLVVVFTISFVTLNSLYQFDGILLPIGSFAFKSRLLGGVQLVNPESPQLGNRFREGLLSGIKVPLPKDYVIGIDSQRWEDEIGFVNLENGRIVRGGTWFGPFVTLSRKMPLGTIALVALSLALALCDLRRPGKALFAVWLPPLFIMALLCCNSGLNWILRYSLVCFPFLFVGVGRVAQFPKKRYWTAILILSCLIWNAYGLLRIRPHYLCFGNECVGGAVGAQQMFLGSNFDWGQDLLRLKSWCSKNPQIQPLALSFYGAVNPDSIGLRVSSLPTSFARSSDEAGPEVRGQLQRPFYWAISSNVLNGMPGTMTFEGASMRTGIVNSLVLKPRNAIARIGYSIYVFRVAPSLMGSQVSNPVTTDRLRGCCTIDVEDTLLMSP